MAIESGKLVSLEYTLKDEAGEMIESNQDSDPLVFIQGNQQIIPGLEREIETMAEGESKDVIVSPEDGYGEVDKEAFVELPLEKIPDEAREIGARLQVTDQQGVTHHPAVSQVGEETIVLDFNHPLAGKVLHFHVKVLEVSEAPAA